MPALLAAVLSSVLLIAVRPAARAPRHPADLPVPAAPLFETADRCIACHSGVVGPWGEDLSIGYDWRASMMANSSRDPYWQASVRREVLDHPVAAAEIEDECATCHMPMARYEAHLAGSPGQVFANLPAGGGERSRSLASDGVSCTTCHQIRAGGLGEAGSFTGGFAVDESTPWGERILFGPFGTDGGRQNIMRSATGFRPEEASHVQRSELCASCHTLYTRALDEEGREVGELPEQMPYLEWRESTFREESSCQDCHMPVVRTPVAVTGVLGQPRDGVNRHTFVGGNFFMLGMLNRYRDELGVEALSQELDASVRRTVERLRAETATLAVEDARVESGVLRADVVVTNMAGHKFPTAYPSRRAWLHFRVSDSAGTVLFDSGSHDERGAIRGNENDADAARFEPHHTRIDDADQVQIYESVMVDPDGRVTTGLLSAVRYVKDNRILPLGFDKDAAAADVAVRGGAAEDGDFQGGGDRVAYEVRVGAAVGPLTVEAELWYQPIGFRWATNLARYEAPEPERFVRYFTEMAPWSALRIAAARADLSEAGQLR